MAGRRRHRRRRARRCGCWPRLLDGFTIDEWWQALARRLRRRRRQRRRVAGAGVRRRADLGAHARDRRDRARRPRRRRSCSTCCPGVDAHGVLDGARDRRRAGGRDDRRLVGPRRRRRRLVRRRRWAGGPAVGAGVAAATDVPGVVFVQIDGLSPSPCSSGRCAPVTSRPCTAGCATAATAWSAGRPGGRRRPASASAASSTARSSTCRRSAGSTRRPATVVVSNHPASAAAIERAHSDGEGLLAHHGSSYGNLFSGDAERAVLTMSVIAKRKEGRVGAGYVGYFSRPQQATRTLIGLVVDVVPRAAWRRWQQVRHGVEPRVARGWSYALLRAFTTVVSRDVSRAGRAQRRLRGPGRDLRRPARLRRGLPPLRARAGRRPRRAARHRPPDRPHRARRCAGRRGRTGWSCSPTTARRRARRSPSGPARRSPSSSPGCAARRRPATPTPRPGGPSRAPGCGAAAAVPSRRGRRPGRHDADRARVGQPRADLRCPARRRRLTREEIDARYPELIAGLTSPSGDRLRARAHGGRRVARARPRRAAATWSSGEVVGDDPLAPFGPRAVEQVARGRRATRPSPT